MKVTRLWAVKGTMAGILMGMMPGAKAADPVSISVTGNIVASPCEIKSDSTNIVVDLGQSIQASALQNAGNATQWVPFDVNLINCPATTSNATLIFQGVPDSSNPVDMYASSGTALNVAVQIQGMGGQPLGNGRSLTGAFASNAYSFHLRARAYTNTGYTTPGTIRTVVTAAITYQ